MVSLVTSLFSELKHAIIGQIQAKCQCLWYVNTSPGWKKQSPEKQFTSSFPELQLTNYTINSLKIMTVKGGFRYEAKLAYDKLDMYHWNTAEQSALSGSERSAKKIGRDRSRCAPSQWEKSLHCKDVSHWLDTYLGWSLDRLHGQCLVFNYSRSDIK